jgi:hypothetical protein
MIRIEENVFSCFLEPSIGVWEDDDYRVCAFLDQNTIRLDIHRKDMRDALGWDVLQIIKTKCGYGAFDAVEFYPRDQDVLNTGNIRHLYLFSTLLPQIRRGYVSKKEA